jgi:large subunit ribosomal protein L15
MRLNQIKSDVKSSKKKRAGRGIGSGLGKTCGRGHKGQCSRSGGYHKIGFRGGQMPLYRCIPKFGFVSRKFSVNVEVRLHELNQLSDNEVVTLESLKQHKIVGFRVRNVKIILSGELMRTLVIRGKGIKATAGALASIQEKGGKVEA